MIIIDYNHSNNPQRRFVSEAHTITIGRATPEQAVDLDLAPDTSVSRRHARITFENGSYWLTDLGSRSGTRINERSIEAKSRVTSGDKIRIGLTLLEVHIPDEGRLTSSISATTPASELLMTQKMGTASLDAARHRLLAMYELGMALGTSNAVGPLLERVVGFLNRVIIDAQRALILLLDEEGLLQPAAQYPHDSRPEISFHLAKTAMDKQEAITWRNKADEEEALSDSMIKSGTQSAMYAPLIWNDELFGVVSVDNSYDQAGFDEDDLRLLMAMANQVAMFIKNHQLQQDLLHQEVVRANLLRQFSPQVADRLEELFLDEKEGVRLGGERADPVTILTSDVRGFTALSAEMDPHDVVQMLNELFGVCIPIIFKYNGTVDKFVGDAILAVFGSPEPDDYQWANAVKAAMEMQKAIERLGEERRERGLAVCQVGIGIHTGPVLHGFIGAEERMEYTVIGDTVNRASRYCDGAGSGEIIISEAVHKHVHDIIETEARVVRTKHESVEGTLDAFLVCGLSNTHTEAID